ncbi:MAG: hypothetical protein FWB74_02930 [Defluviitaleaceae bacterium]|nr:hypothetical protein [Defluviitaleaceae bacterium]
MIDVKLVNRYGRLLPNSYFDVIIGGYIGKAQGCVLDKLSIGDLTMERVFVMAYPFDSWLTGHILLGANVMNNWDLTISRSDDVIRLVERVPVDAPNKVNSYQNFFKNGKYMALQEEEFELQGGV